MIKVVDDFFTEKELNIFLKHIETCDFVFCKNENGEHFGHKHYFNLNNSNEWLFKKIKNTFFPTDSLKIHESSFAGRHNKDKVLTHLDNYADFNCIIYLKGKELMYNGTGFYNKKGSLDRYVGFICNRALFFNGKNIMHTDLQALGPSSYRYTLNVFYVKENK
tara:strand:- start:113 stop:601 length:489 start_codon:yes stop_codon:yes gene_type:complete